MQTLQESQLNLPVFRNNDIERQEITKIWQDKTFGRTLLRPTIDILKVKVEDLENKIKDENPYAGDLLNKIIVEFTIPNIYNYY